MTTSIEPNRSSEYIQLIELLKNSITSSVDIALRLYEQGKRDGLANERIREDIEIAFSGIVKERQLRNILPLELKRHYTLDPNDNGNDNGNDNDSAMIAELDDNREAEGEGERQRTYAELLEQFKSEIDKTMSVYVGNLCLEVRDKNARLSNEGIQKKVLRLVTNSLSREVGRALKNMST